MHSLEQKMATLHLEQRCMVVQVSKQLKHLEVTASAVGTAGGETHTRQ